MKTVINFFIIGIIAITVISALPAQSKKTVATIFKPVGSVDHKSGDKEWIKAKPATPLMNGDIIRTQENSFAIIKFLENSVIRVQEKSEVTIRGEISKNEYSKNVHLESGEVGFNVKKRPNEKFEFTTPTSVASIRGTDGLLITGQDSTDVLILGSGRVDFKNLVSNIVLSVKGGQTGYSMADGSIKVEESTPEDQRLMNQAKEDSSVFEGSNEGGSDTDTTTSVTGISLGLSISAPVGKENQDLVVSVEVTQSSITIDSLKKSVIDFTFYYRPKADKDFKFMKAQFARRVTKFTVPANDVFAPELAVYATMKLADGSEFSVPAVSPETNPVKLPLQAGKSNELKIPFTDPTGKKKTMIIEYK